MADLDAAAPASVALFDRAKVVTPGGVNSPVRAFRAVGGTPRFMVRGDGPYLCDADGTRFVDLVCSWGPMILGHAHPDVRRGGPGRRRRTARRSGPRRRARCCSPRRSWPGSRRSSRCAWSAAAPRRRCRAVRLARGFTGRTKVVKFAGCYHGHVDALLAAAGSGVATLGLPDTPGRHRRDDGRDDRAAVQRRGRRTRGVPAVRRPDRLRDHRGGRRQHGRRPAAAGLQRDAARPVPPPRRAADHGRGDDRVPARAGPVGTGSRAWPATCSPSAR